MKPINLKIALTTVLGSALLSACGGGGSDTSEMTAVPPPTPVATTPDVTVAVPAEVSTSPAAATSYVTSLSSQSEASADTLDPVVVPEQLAQDDTAEPA